MDSSATASLTPKVSVILPVFNGEKYIREAIESILTQSFYDFELIILNDGSTDHSDEIISSFSDSRIVFIRSHQNIGLIATLNQGIQAARGTYLARMDADDISLPHRLQAQVDFLDMHPEIGVVGGGYLPIDSDGLPVSAPKFWPEYPVTTKWLLLVCNPVCHPSTMIRSDLIRQVGGYQIGFSHAEDYELWTRLALHTGICSIQDTLLLYRVTPSERVSTDHFKEQVEITIQIRQLAAERLFGLHMDPLVSVAIQGDRPVPERYKIEACNFLSKGYQSISTSLNLSVTEQDEFKNLAQQYVWKIIERMKTITVATEIIHTTTFFSRKQILKLICDRLLDRINNS
jgi:glycosyltransferase involved in cell wall biosynthesis